MSKKPQPSTLGPRLSDLAVVALALVVRIITAVQLGVMPLSRVPHYDSLEYLAWARRVAIGDFTWPSFPPHGPGYPYFLGVVLAIFGGSLMAARVIQSIIGALTCWLAARTTKELFGPRAGIAAGVLLAIYAPLIWTDVSIMAEGLLIFTMAAALWTTVTGRHPALTGIILGVAAVTRPTALIILPLLVVLGLRTWRLRAVMTACTLAVIAPVTIANWRVSHSFIPVQAFGGMNFYLGNSPLRDGLASARPGGDWDRIEPEAARHGAVSPLDDDRYFVRKTRTEITQHPLAYAGVVLRKLVWTFQDDELRDTHSFYFFRRSAPLLWLPSFAILFGLAAAGAFVANWRDRGPRLLAGYVALTALTTVALVVASRYRMPMILGLAPFAGLAVDRLLQRPERRQVMGMAAIAVLAAALTFIWKDASTHNPAEELALTGESLMSEEKYAEAEATARNAVEADPENALAHDALGMALAASGRPLNARTALQRATSFNPDFAAARIHLGHLYEQLDDIDGATNAYEHAIVIDPRDPRPLRPLAAIELHRGNIARAIELTSRLATLAPDSGTWLDLARLQGAAGKPEAGLESARRAMVLREPESGEWLLVANLATDAHQFEAAQQAIDRAQAAGAPPPAVSFATALLRFREGKLDEAAQIANQLAAQQPGFKEAGQLQAAIENARHPR